MDEAQFKQRLKEHEAYRKLPSHAVKFPYNCSVCHVEHWLSFDDIMARKSNHTLPCGHDWNKTYYKPAEWEAHKAHNPINTVTIRGS